MPYLRCFDCPPRSDVIIVAAAGQSRGLGNAAQAGVVAPRHDDGRRRDAPPGVTP
jgi:hypothetical protein